MYLSPRKLNRIRELSSTAQKYPLTFATRLDAIPLRVLVLLPARDIADLIDYTLTESHRAGMASIGS
jgi:hypothetical protein